MHPSSLAIAAADTDAENLFGDMLPWLGLLVLIVLLGGGVAIWIRKRMANSGDSGTIGYTLEDLRVLHSRGELSEEEYSPPDARTVTGRPAATASR